MITLVLGILIARSAVIQGDSVVWTCKYQTSSNVVTIQQAAPCEPAKQL